MHKIVDTTPLHMVPQQSVPPLEILRQYLFYCYEVRKVGTVN